MAGSRLEPHQCRAEPGLPLFAHDLDQARASGSAVPPMPPTRASSSRLVGRRSAMLRSVLSWKITNAGTFCSRAGAQAAQRVEQGQVLRQYRQAGALRAALASAAAAGRVAAHADLAAAGQHVAAGIGQAQATVTLAVHFQQAGRDQLAEHAAPGACIEVAADGISAQLVVACCLTFRSAAAQDVDQVADTEALAAAVDAAQRLLCRYGRVPRGRWRQAVVAVAARLG